MTLRKLFYTSTASVGGVGLIKFAPGTWGSLFAAAIVFPFAQYEYFVPLLLGATAIAYIKGHYACVLWLADNAGDDDPSAIVIDELVGMWLTLALVAAVLPLDLAAFTLSFVAFRLFDILKPFPIDWMDKNIKGASGIMLDDVAAGLFAAALVIVAIKIGANYV